MATLPKCKRLLDAYRSPGFRPLEKVRGVFGDPKARVVTLVRRSKKTVCNTCGRRQMGWYGRRWRRVRDLSCGDMRIYLEFEVRRIQCQCCGRVKREQLAFLAGNPFYTKRFAYYVGRRYRVATIQELVLSAAEAVVKEVGLDWHTVKELDKQHMRAQLARAGHPAPKVIGIDEVSIRKRHVYRIVVSDLLRARQCGSGARIAARRACSNSTIDSAKSRQNASVWR